MSLRYAHPERDGITEESIVFDDLTDAFIAIEPIIPAMVAEEKNGVGWETLVSAFVAMSKALSRFEMTDESRFATDYTKESDVMAAVLGLLKWRCSQAKSGAAAASLKGTPEARGHVRRCSECYRAMLHLKKLTDMMRKRVVARRAELNRAYEEASPMRAQKREERYLSIREQRAISKAENKAKWSARHDGLEGRDGGIGTG